MNSKQFAWLYMIENGMAGQEPAYYGGYDFIDKAAKDCPGEVYSFSDPKSGKVRDLYLSQIKAIGVDWKRTESPRNENFTIFEGTFCDASSKECLTGEIILNNGVKQSWCADNIEVTNVFDMMAELDAAKSRASELFGVV